MRTWAEAYDDEVRYPPVLKTSRVSKKTRKCAVCYGEIKPGQRYVRVFLPPRDGETSFTYIEHVGDGACVFGML